MNLDYRNLINTAEIVTNSKRKGFNKYLELYCAFDIETSQIISKKLNWMYIWQFAMKLPGQEAQAIYGRTWEEFKRLMKYISMCLPDDVILKVFVHNLAYEFQYLSTFENELEMSNTFCMKVRKPLKTVIFDNIEICCSYALTNLSLAKLTERYDVIHKKMSGDEFNYNDIRFSDTELSEEKIKYSLNDVLGLVEAIEKINSLNNDTIATMPLTNTGYVRRDFKNNCDAKQSFTARDMFPNIEEYTLLKNAFRGGDTHANRFKAGKLIANVRSFDRKSSYPAVQVCRPFPMKKFKKIRNLTDKTFKYYLNKKVPFLVKIGLYDVHSSADNVCPYLSKSKCLKCINGTFDNGRVLDADYIEMVMTDIDLNIFLKEYECKGFTCFDLYVSKYAYLPQSFIDTVMDYFTKKCTLDGVPGQELFYMKSKNMLNSIYGMTATDPVRDLVEYEEDYKITKANITEMLRKAKQYAFLTFHWGVWCTAWARWELHQFIQIVGKDFIYADTDSVKFTGDYDTEILQLNSQLKQLAIDRKGYVSHKGHDYHLGVWEEEPLYKQFKTLGAKKYAYIDTANRLNITIAGVNKKKGAKELDKMGGIKAFREGTIFKEAGGLEAIYNDDECYKVIKIDGHDVEITKNIVLKPSTYTIGITNEYQALIYDLQNEI